MRIEATGTAILIFFTSLLAIPVVQAETERLNPDPQHDQGVQLARDGKHRQGLAVLEKILQKQPDNYAVRRDSVIIATWAKDCDLALEHYEFIQDAPKKEAYLLIPVAECLHQQDRQQEAITLLQNGRQDWPDDEELKEKLVEYQQQRQLDTAPTISATLRNDTSDQGNVEWLFETRYGQQIFTDTRAYARFLAVRADDPEFDTGDLNRIGAGITHHLTYQVTLDAEVSTDVKQSGEEGITLTGIYTPYYLWEVGAQYASFAEDVPLRAKALRITSDRTTIFAGFHTDDYRWTWSGSTNYYDFSDGNERRNFYTDGSYAYYLEWNLEHRVTLGWFQSHNTLDDTVYYNPKDDRSVTLTHKTSYVYDSRFERHADHFSIYAGNYWQRNYNSEMIYGISFQQEYGFTLHDYFSWGAQVGSAVYDAQREDETHVFITYEHKF
ncbi:hypothetical protein [Kaarinaea lacus]